MTFYQNNQFPVTKLLFTKTDNSPLKLATAVKKSRDYTCKREGTHHAWNMSQWAVKGAPKNIKERHYLVRFQPKIQKP